MSQQEEQPRQSLRLRKAPDRPPDTPPPAPPAEPPPAAPAAPAETPPAATGRLRLSSIINPDAAGSTPPAPPPSPPEPPPVALAAPPPAFEPAPAPVPVPEPLPVATPAPVQTAPIPVAPPPPPPPPPAPAAAPTPPPAEPARTPNFPPPPGFEKKENEEPRPPSPRTIGLALGGVIILVLGGIGYLFFLDPLGLFKDAEPPQAAAPAVTAPAATAPAQTPAQPAPAAAAAAEPGLIEETPEFTMPPPAPLAAGEEIAPGVVRLPPDADSVSGSDSAAFPAPRTFEPPAPKPNPAYTALVNNLNISGIRPNSSGGFLMIGTMLYRPGDIVDQQSRLEFVGLDGQVITFKDPAGAVYTRRF